MEEKPFDKIQAALQAILVSPPRTKAPSSPNSKKTLNKNCRQKKNKDRPVKSFKQLEKMTSQMLEACLMNSKAGPTSGPRIKTSKKASIPGVTYDCEVCKKSLLSKGALKLHMRIHTGERPYECEICHHKFRHMQGLSAHKRSHINGNPLKCDICKMEFKNYNSFKSHKLSHVRMDRKFKCQVCGEMFPSAFTRRHHMKKHANQVVYECPKCHQRFSNSQALKAHMPLHENGKNPNTCDKCSQDFESFELFDAHNKREHGNLNFLCEICNKHLPIACNYEAHMQVHVGELPFECRICHQKFRNTYDLNQHTMAEHKLDPSDKSGIDKACKRYGLGRNVCKSSNKQAALLKKSKNIQDAIRIVIKLQPKKQEVLNDDVDDYTDNDNDEEDYDSLMEKVKHYEKISISSQKKKKKKKKKNKKKSKSKKRNEKSSDGDIKTETDDGGWYIAFNGELDEDANEKTQSKKKKLNKHKEKDKYAEKVKIEGEHSGANNEACSSSSNTMSNFCRIGKKDSKDKVDSNITNKQLEPFDGRDNKSADLEIKKSYHLIPNKSKKDNKAEVTNKLDKLFECPSSDKPDTQMIRKSTRKRKLKDYDNDEWLSESGFNKPLDSISAHSGNGLPLSRKAETSKRQKMSKKTQEENVEVKEVLHVDKVEKNLIQNDNVNNSCNSDPEDNQFDDNVNNTCNSDKDEDDISDDNVDNIYSFEDSELDLYDSDSDGPMSYTCEICGKVVEHQSDLRIHMRTHTHEKPFECDICLIRFRDQQGLRLHKQVHTTQFDSHLFKCPICHEMFPDATMLAKHKASHPKRKTFKCPVCDQEICSASNYRRHMLLHENESDYKCPMCEKQFRHPQALVAHLHLHDND